MTAPGAAGDDFRPRRQARAVDDEGWIRDFLAQAAVGTLATVAGEQPFAHPNLFLFDPRRHAVYFHTARSGRTRLNLEANRRACFAVFEMGRLLPAARIAEYSTEYASVMLFGPVEIVADPEEARWALQAQLDKYFPPERLGSVPEPFTEEEMVLATVYRLDVERWSAKRHREPDDFPGAFRRDAAIFPWRGGALPVYDPPHGRGGMTDERYPVGSFDPSAPAGPEEIAAAVHDIRELPTVLAGAVEGLDDDQLDTPYRSGGWTVRQVVHHVADSHVNGYVRLRLALTEERPVLRSYEQDRWAALPDASEAPVALSLALLEALHARWSRVLEGLEPRDFHRSLLAPGGDELTVGQLTCLYGWHSRHHVAHITSLRRRRSW